jgi:SnoaL-like polyketide cyclase
MRASCAINSVPHSGIQKGPAPQARRSSSTGERLFTAVPDLNVRDEFKAENGDTAINEWSMSGTNSGPLETPEGIIPATGKPVTLRGCDALTVREGRIRSHRAYYD